MVAIVWDFRLSESLKMCSPGPLALQGLTNLIFASTDFHAHKIISCVHLHTQNYMYINSHCGR